MMIFKKLITVVGTVLLLAGASTQAQYAQIRNFTGGLTDGAYPVSSLTLSGDSLYGMTRFGFNNQLGMVFKINTNGTDYTILTNGIGFSSLIGTLQLSGSSLYGVSDAGLFFRMNTDGTGFTKIIPFSFLPVDTLTQFNETFFGMSVNNTIFKINYNGTGYGILYHFGQIANDGNLPIGTLDLVGSTLYGMCAAGGGTDNSGTVFKINTDGSGYTILHAFSAADGTPFGSLNMYGPSLYGVTANAGVPNKLFKVNIDGSGYKVLYSFPSIGTLTGGLTLQGTQLYGMAAAGAGADSVFVISISGNGFTNLHTFASANDGNTPVGSPVVNGLTLFGLTEDGGTNGTADFGTIFSLTTSTAASVVPTTCSPTAQPQQHPFVITRTASYWFAHAYNNDPSCITLGQAISTNVVNNGALGLGFLCLPTTDYAGNIANSALMEALGFYYKGTSLTGDKTPASVLCQARKKLVPELIAAIANNVLLGTGPGNASYNNGGVLTNYPSDLIERAGRVAGGSDVSQIQVMTALLHKFNGSGVTNDFIYGVECSPNSRSFLTKIARDPTTFLNCPGVNSSCQTAEIVVIPSSDNPFATVNFKRSVDTRKFAGICANISTNSRAGASGSNSVVYVCFGGSGYWVIPPSLGSANRHFTVTTAKSNFPVDLTVSRGDCANLVTLVTASNTNSYFPVQAQFSTDGTNTFYIQAGSYTTVGGVQVSSGVYGKLNLTITSP